MSGTLPIVTEKGCHLIWPLLLSFFCCVLACPFISARLWTRVKFGTTQSMNSSKHCCILIIHTLYVFHFRAYFELRPVGSYRSAVGFFEWTENCSFGYGTTTCWVGDESDIHQKWGLETDAPSVDEAAWKDFISVCDVHSEDNSSGLLCHWIIW